MLFSCDGKYEQYFVLIVLSMSNFCEILFLLDQSSALSTPLRIYVGIQLILCLKNILLRHEAIMHSYKTLLKRDGTDDTFVFISMIILTVFIQQQKYSNDLGVFIPFYVMSVIFNMLGLYMYQILDSITENQFSNAAYNTV